MWVVTQIGGGWTALLLGAGLLLARQANLALEIVLGTLSLALLVEGLKELTNRARPYLIHAEARVIGWRAPGRSFPSGHTSQAFFLMTLLNFLWGAELPLTIALYATAVAVGITRMYVGAHFPRDVVGGSILGMAWGIFFILIDPFWHTWFVF
jgi:membrane-associated phospholipid phosphatase